MDPNITAGNQIEAVRRCTAPKPISAEDARKMLGLFPLVGASRSPAEIQVLIARVSLDQSVRLEESIDKLEQKSSRLSSQLVYLNWILVFLTIALVVLAGVTLLAERHRDDLSAALSEKQVREKQTIECAEQARRVGQDMGKYSSGFGPPSNISGVSNHYNRQLGKCIVDVQTVDKGGTVEFVMDAYEQSNILFCSTRFAPKGVPSMQRICMDYKNNRMDPAEADKQLEGLMRN